MALISTKTKVSFGDLFHRPSEFSHPRSASALKCKVSLRLSARLSKAFQSRIERVIGNRVHGTAVTNKKDKHPLSVHASAPQILAAQSE